MKTIQNYIEKIEDAYNLASPYLSLDALSVAEEKCRAIIDNLRQNSYIKVPFVGDFNAGKSTMLNALLGRNILPTDIKPETAVSYELYYSDNERIEIYHGSSKESLSIEQISNTSFSLGDYVKLYVNNEIVRDLNDRGIVVVDMPGIGSGIEAHNRAIMNYIEKGTSFVLATDIREGTLTSSTIDFIREIKKYSLSCSVIITKKETKTESERVATIASISDYVHKICAPDTFIGSIAAHDGDIHDLENLLATLDGETFAEQKFHSEITEYIKSLILQMDILKGGLLAQNADLQKVIDDLEGKKEEFLGEIEGITKKAQPINSSVEDILNDVRCELCQNSRMLANFVYSNAESDSVNEKLGSQILGIVRPILLQSIQRESIEYQSVIGEALQTFVEEIKSVLEDKNNPFINGADQLLGNVVIKEALEELLEAGIIKLLAKLGITKVLGPVVGTIVGMILSILPDIARKVFGVGKDGKVKEIISILEGNIYDQVIMSLRQPVTEMLTEQRKLVDDATKAAIEQRIAAINTSIEQAKAQNEYDAETRSQKVSDIQDCIDTLTSLI